VTAEILDLGEVRGLASRLAQIPQRFQPRARRMMRAAGQDVLGDASGNASWSSRIPASLSLRVSLKGNRVGIAVRASLKTAAHARVYEGILGDTFKHPLFGDREHWYTQAARPYLLPAVERQSEQIVAELTRIVDDVNAQAGLS
jgi:hypothetical protein